MMTLLLTIIYLFLIISSTFATLNPEGLICGDQKCSPSEYCSPFDTQCRPCSGICDPESHNHQADLCAKDCQEYLHDQRYVLRTDLRLEEELRDEIHRQWTFLKISLCLTGISLLAIIYLLTKTLIKWRNLKGFLQKVFGKKWLRVKKKHENKVRDDVEINAPKQNGLRLTMPTISGNLTELERTNDTTLSTVSADLSKNNASEDSVLDYAYDNLGMTPSPETSQVRSKRESSF